MKNLRVKQEDEVVFGTGRKSEIIASYNQLLAAFGPPTFPDRSPDDKVRKEWVFDFCGEEFTLYDYCYLDGWRDNEEIQWNIGGKTYAGEFRQAVLSALAKLK